MCDQNHQSKRNIKPRNSIGKFDEHNFYVINNKFSSYSTPILQQLLTIKINFLFTQWETPLLQRVKCPYLTDFTLTDEKYFLITVNGKCYKRKANFTKLYSLM